MSNPSFGEAEACVFDAYGTLFDVHSAAARMKDELGEKADALSEMWRLKQLQYTWLRSLMGRHEDFWQVTGDALDYAMRALDMENDSLRAKLMDAERRRRAEDRAATRRGQVGTGDRSEKIRTYNFPQNRLTDHRIGLTVHSLAQVLQGDLSAVIEALRRASRERQTEGP